MGRRSIRKSYRVVESLDSRLCTSASTFGQIAYRDTLRANGPVRERYGYGHVYAARGAELPEAVETLRRRGRRSLVGKHRSMFRSEHLEAGGPRVTSGETGFN